MVMSANSFGNKLGGGVGAAVLGFMLEAFCDMTDFPALSGEEGVQRLYAPWHALEEKSVSGNLLTNIFAGGTVNTEGAFHRLRRPRGLPGPG